MIDPVFTHLACLTLVGVDMTARAVRIRVLVKGLGARLSLADALRLNLLGDAAAELTPFRAGGEPARVGGLLQSRVPAETAVLAVGAELALSYGLVALLVAAASWNALPAWWSSIAPALQRIVGVVPLGLLALVGAAIAWAIVRRRPRDHGGNVRLVGVGSSLAALFRIPRRSIATVFALGAPNTLARLGILWMLAATVPGAPPASTILVGSFVLLFGQAFAPTPSGLGVVEMGMLGGAAGPLGPHAVSILLYWRTYTAVLPIGLAVIFALPRFGVGPLVAVLGLRRRRPGPIAAVVGPITGALTPPERC